MPGFQFLYKARTTPSFWRLLTVLITLVGMLLLSWVMFNPIRVKAKAPGPVPVAIHSEYTADYSVDPTSFVVPPISLELIDEVIRDSGRSLDRPELNQPFESLSAASAAAGAAQRTSPAQPTQTPEEIEPQNTVPAATATPKPSLEPASTLVVALPTATPLEVLLPDKTNTPASLLPILPTKAAPGLQRPTKIPKLTKTPKPAKKLKPTTKPQKIK